MILLGIDPGTASMGFGIIKFQSKEIILRHHGVIKTSASAQMPDRLLTLYNNLNDLVKEFNPDLLILERLFFNSNVKTAMSVGQARGIPMLVAAKFKLELVEYTALQAKKALTGYGRASKKEMQESVKEVLSLTSIIKSDDANDAVAMALCYLKVKKYV